MSGCRSEVGRLFQMVRSHALQSGMLKPDPCDLPDDQNHCNSTKHIHTWKWRYDSVGKWPNVGTGNDRCWRCWRLRNMRHWRSRPCCWLWYGNLVAQTNHTSSDQYIFNIQAQQADWPVYTVKQNKRHRFHFSNYYVENLPSITNKISGSQGWENAFVERATQILFHKVVQ